MQGRSLRFATLLAETMDQLLLQLIRKTILGSEKDHSTLSDCDVFSTATRDGIKSRLMRTRDSEISNQLIRIVRIEYVLHDRQRGEFAPNDRCNVFRRKLIESTREL